jgi:uncharacterized protein YbbC (DUF1343 family)
MSRTIGKPRRSQTLLHSEGTDPSRPSQSGRLSLLLAIVLGAACAEAPARSAASDEVEAPVGSAAASDGVQTRVRAGVEVLLTDSLHLVDGRRVGLITNHTGIWVREPDPGAGAADVASTIDALDQAPGVELVALYGPEHGIRGDAEAGAPVGDAVDQRTGVPIHSLYGETLRPTPSMLEGVDVLLFDMQDVGARYYTYVSTMAYAMEAAGELAIPFVVLDRPNPIRGDAVQGNVLDPEYATFVGLYPVPMRHGMTAGELARMYVGEFGIEVELHVVPVDGLRRDMTFDETGLPWVPPSPNMPSLESALAYSGTCLFEGTPLSVGRGTARAFQWVGAPWLDGEALAAALNGYGIEGVRFEAATFTPRGAGDGKFDGVEVHGVELIPESSAYDAPAAAVAMLIETMARSGDSWAWRVSHFDRLSGTDRLRLALEAGESFETITGAWAAGLARFEELRGPYLIYR